MGDENPMGQVIQIDEARRDAECHASGSNLTLGALF